MGAAEAVNDADVQTAVQLHEQGLAILAQILQVRDAILNAQPENKEEARRQYYEAEGKKHAWEADVIRSMTRQGGVRIKSFLASLRPQVTREFLHLQNLFRENILGARLLQSSTPQPEDVRLRISFMSPSERAAHFK